MLDGDELRKIFCAAATQSDTYARNERLALAMRYAQLCRVIAHQGLIVVISTISLFKEVHAWNRENLPGYCEVYLKVPLVELRRRDTKGLYRRFDAGELTNVVGLDVPIDEPSAADLVVAYSPEQTAERVADDIVNILNARKSDDTRT